MLKKLSGGSLWKSKNPHSLEYLRYLQGVLVKNDKIGESNRALVIEALRAITEILIWGDQNDAAVFDFFLERQMFLHFLRIMQQTEANYVNIQLLQTLNILFENIRNETSIYFLLSNNHVNSIITFGFDFTNEEIIAYYISFLKTLSFKLNVKTVHFFFSEITDEFPLFTEAIKFYKHNESMVRIAVRTLTLNIFKINEETLNNFVILHSREYFNDVCSEAAIQIIEMDTFARSAQNESSNRNRLLQLMDVHMDNLHYINDILSIGKEKLNTLIIESLHRFLIGPIYLASLASLRSQPQTILVSRVTSLFLFSQFVRIIHETKTVQSVLTALFFDDYGDIRTEWLRTLDKGLHLESIGKKWEKHQPQEDRGSFHSQLIAALHEGQQDDHACLFALLLIQCIFQNSSVPKDLFDAAQLPFPNNSTTNQQWDPEMTECLLRIVENCSLTDTQIRPITLELCCMIFRHILICLEPTNQTFYSTIGSIVKKTQHKLTNILKGAFQTEKLFLEMFEDEYYQLQKNELKIATLLEDPGLYLPPSNTPLSGLNLTKRIPSGNDERNRRSLEFFFIIRRFGQDLFGESEQLLPLFSKIQPMVELNDCINLNNSDLLSVTVHSLDKNERQSRFLVTDQFQLILVEPDSRRLGWAIVRFVGLLQDVQITGTSDSRALNVVVEDVKTRAAHSNSRPLLSAKFVFDDHIRCMAAKQRLNRGRKRSRAYKLGLIAELFGMRLPQQQQGNGLNSLPNSPQLGGIQRHRLVGVPGSVQKLFSPTIAINNNDQRQQFETIPPDPDTSTSASSKSIADERRGRIHHI